MIILRGVNVFPTQVEERVLAVPGLAPYFQIELIRAGNMDAMRVHVECLAGANSAACQEALARGIKEMVGVSADVVMSEAGGVERSQGKARRVVDRRGER